ncbi:mitochondrial inner membrane protein-domain-containing protein [Tuber borchii]|uniref:MICOS complex subunit MIC60 n=1 Tax=Tuber borchii TaxID=42251 RepID=A0A2T6ZF02_TUBBO|nr:mitochondrial inner membrane protein-domain-containing protein [Tuber borchii]
MLRLSSSASARVIGFSSRSTPSRHQRHSLKLQQTQYQQQRFLADTKVPRPDTSTKRSIKDVKPPVLPGGAHPATPAKPPPAAAAAASPISPTPKITTTPVAPSNTSPTPVPLTSPPPAKTQTSPPIPAPKVPPSATTSAGFSAPPPPPPLVSSPVAPPKQPKKTHRLRNFVVGLTFITGLSFAGGVFYSLKSDNFHDFFTEYIPFGEEAVLYFEEREFRRRFPNALSRVAPPPIDSPKVVIPKASGATWKVFEPTEDKKVTDVGKHGPHISSRGTVEQDKEGGKAISVPVGSGTDDAAEVEAAEKLGKPKAPTGHIALVDMRDVEDPVVRDLANVVNSIITLVNESESPKVFDSVITTAKSELSHLSSQIASIKQGLEKTVKEKDLEFTTAAQGLLKNVDDEITNIEHKWREEFEKEREKMAQSYREKLHTELQRSGEVAEHRLRNELLEQAIAMKRKWIRQIEDRVESERNGRLGKLKELSGSVEELAKLSTAWTDILDANLKTQQMHVALEAVRAAYESPEQPKPFLRELAALKEVADDDEVVRAAIASINPLAYQKGVSTPTQLIDRFRRVSDEVRKASLLPEDAGVAGHAASWALSKVLFRKKGLAQGDDVESILTRTETYLEEGDIDNAAREMNQLSGWARVLAKDWLKEARLFLEVQQAVEVIAAEARLQSLRVHKP